MLSQKTIDRLNNQINLEIYSSHLYLQMSSWCAHKALDGCAAFLSKHADEEMAHMRRLLNYVQETGAYAVISGMQAPAAEFNSLTECLGARSLASCAERGLRPIVSEADSDAIASVGRTAVRANLRTRKISY